MFLCLRVCMANISAEMLTFNILIVPKMRPHQQNVLRIASGAHTGPYRIAACDIWLCIRLCMVACLWPNGPNGDVTNHEKVLLLFDDFGPKNHAPWPQEGMLAGRENSYSANYNRFSANSNSQREVTEAATRSHCERVPSPPSCRTTGA